MYTIIQQYLQTYLLIYNESLVNIIMKKYEIFLQRIFEVNQLIFRHLIKPKKG